MKKQIDNLIGELPDGEVYYVCSHPDICIPGCEYGEVLYYKRPIQNIPRCFYQRCQID